MTPELKEHLKAIARKRRGQLLKDCTVADLLVACDYVEMERSIPTNTTNPLGWAYLKYATPDQVATLCGRLPHHNITVAVPVTGAPKERVVFCGDFLRALLAFLTDHPGRYYANTVWDLATYLRQPGRWR
jgi:hypothetical protein